MTTVNGIALLAQISGLNAREVAEIAAEVHANRDRLAACGRHDFVPLEGAQYFGKLPRKLICRACQGVESSQRVGAYIAGLAHATGGDAAAMLEEVCAKPPMAAPEGQTQ